MMPISSPKRIRKFPIGTSSFAELVSRKEDAYVNYFVDKTLFIQQLIESSGKVLLFPRFRRCGKSMNLDMLRCFFDVREKEINRKLFEGLKIERARLSGNEPCMNYQGQYPVIFLDFKKLSQSNYKEMYEQFKMLLSDVYGQHRYLIASPKIEKYQKEMIQAVIERKADDATYKNALNHLMEYMHHHHDNKKVIILIDEYDVPFQRAIHQGLYGKEDVDKEYLKGIKDLFSIFLGDALKGNDKYLEKCVMTGIVRIAGAGIFSQLNNLDVWTIFDKKFSDCFGFTEEELVHLLEETSNREKLAQFREWYNGYRFGNSIIYNPWSVIKCLDRNKFDTYWLDTSNNDLVREKILNCRNTQEAHEINETIGLLLAGSEVKKIINESLIFDSRTETVEHLWILLLSTGYLKVNNIVPTGAGIITCTIAIPNIEVKSIYEQIFKDWLAREGIKEDSPLITHLLKGNAKEFCEELEKFFKHTVSVRDIFERKKQRKASKEEKEDEDYEAYYHGFMVGILGLSIYGAKHKVLLTSNRESGHGYYDLQLEPKNPADPIYNKAIIFEFKRCLEEKDLEKEAKVAFKQIKEKEYETNLHERGVKTIVLIAVAFHRKKLKHKHEEVSTDKLNYKKVQLSSIVNPSISIVSALPAAVPSTASLSLMKPAPAAAEKKRLLTDFFESKSKTEEKKQKLTSGKSAKDKEEKTTGVSEANLDDDEILVSSDEDSNKLKSRPVKK